MKKLTDISNQSLLYGAKSINLSILMNKNFSIANGFSLSEDYISELKLNNFDLLEDKKLLNPNKLYAIRSSAIGEDSKDNSFAGIFKSKINVPYERIEEAIKEVNDSFYSRKAEVYAKLKNATYKPCILIQEMVESDFSAVVFIKNKTITMSIQKGLCDNIVSGNSNSLEFEFDIDNYLKVEHDIINKLSFRPQFASLIKDIKSLKELFGNNLDIELAFNLKENSWYILQVRDLIL